MDYARATQIAAALGQSVAFLFGLIGILTNPFLIFIALFVWIGAAQEASMVQMKSALAGIPVSRAMLTDYRTLAPTDQLARAIDLIVTGSQQDFPVIEDGGVVGILTRTDLLVAVSQRGPTAGVGEVMRREFRIAESGELLETAFARLQECDCHTMPVIDKGQLVGLMTMENVGEFLMIQAALGSAARAVHL
jgi:predicted transcriptional regulator